MIRPVILNTLKDITQGDVRKPTSHPPPRPRGRSGLSDLLTVPSQWKVLVVDEFSKKILDNVAKEDDILNQNVASMSWPSTAPQSLPVADRVQTSSASRTDET